MGVKSIRCLGWQRCWTATLSGHAPMGPEHIGVCVCAPRCVHARACKRMQVHGAHGLPTTRGSAQWLTEPRSSSSSISDASRLLSPLERDLAHEVNSFSSSLSRSSCGRAQAAQRSACMGACEFKGACTYKDCLSPSILHPLQCAPSGSYAWLRATS